MVASYSGLSMADGTPVPDGPGGPILRPWPPFGLRFPGIFPTVLKKRIVRRYGHFPLFSFQKPRVSGLFPTSPGSPDRRQSEPTSLCETGLKIRWTYHPCGFESHHRHHGPFSRGLFLCVAGPEKRLYLGIFSSMGRVPPPVSLKQASLLSPTFHPFDPARSLLSFSPFQHF